jgi:hypothetical protein
MFRYLRGAEDCLASAAYPEERAIELVADRDHVGLIISTQRGMPCEGLGLQVRDLLVAEQHVHAPIHLTHRSHRLELGLERGQALPPEGLHPIPLAGAREALVRERSGALRVTLRLEHDVEPRHAVGPVEAGHSRSRGGALAQRRRWQPALAQRLVDERVEEAIDGYRHRLGGGESETVRVLADPLAGRGRAPSSWPPPASPSSAR